MRNQSGFTLIELIISMLITSVLAGVVFSSFSFCRRVTHHSGNKIAAINLVKTKLEEIRGDIKTNQFANLSSWQGETTNCVVNEGPTTAKKDDIDATLVITLTGKDASDADVAIGDTTLVYVEVQAVITWNYLGPPFVETITVETNITL